MNTLDQGFRYIIYGYMLYVLCFCNQGYKYFNHKLMLYINLVKYK